jgi:hypothetical protein
MRSSIVSSRVNWFFAITRCPGRSALFSIAFGLVCLATFSPSAGFLARSPAEPQKRPKRQSLRIKEYPDDAGGGPLEQSHVALGVDAVLLAVCASFAGHKRSPDCAVTALMFGDERFTGAEESEFGLMAASG